MIKFASAGRAAVVSCKGVLVPVQPIESCICWGEGARCELRGLELGLWAKKECKGGWLFLSWLALSSAHSGHAWVVTVLPRNSMVCLQGGAIRRAVRKA